MEKFVKVLLAVLVLAVTAAVTYLLAYISFVTNGAAGTVGQKVRAVEEAINNYYVEDYDPEVMEAAAADAAAEAMVNAIGDEWAYYIPASELDSHMETMQNEYVGVGISVLETSEGMQVLSVVPNGPAQLAGVRAGDYIIAVEGTSLVGENVNTASGMIRGEEGTDVTVTILREGETMEVTMTRSKIINQLATYELLENGIGLITIANFDGYCAEQTLACVDEALADGATSLIFDVRFNPGGIKDEMVEILDELLPEGDIFRSVDYEGYEEIDRSDAECIEIPMVVLVNYDSYSAAEFFAAALQEYGVAQIVGSQTYGKGHFQFTITLNDGSGVNISAGRYYTPNGKSLIGVGVIPDVVVDLSEEDYELLYTNQLEQAEDEQLQAAIALLSEKNS